MKNRNELKEYINKKVNELLIDASENFDREFPKIEISFKLKGVCAGMFTRDINKKRFKFNLDIFDLNQDNFDQTIIHEVAHYITSEKYGYDRKIKPHGKEWKYIIVELGGKAKRCHNLKISKSTRKLIKFQYKCDCRIHMISKFIHNRISHGTIYYCKLCKGIIERD